MKKTHFTAMLIASTLVLSSCHVPGNIENDIETSSLPQITEQQNFTSTLLADQQKMYEMLENSDTLFTVNQLPSAVTASVYSQVLPCFDRPEIKIVGDSLILIGNEKDEADTFISYIARYDKNTLLEINRIEYDPHQCYARTSNNYIMLLYQDCVKYYDENLNYIDSLDITHNSLYHQTQFYTYEPEVADSSHIVFINETLTITILDVLSGDEITISDYNGLKIDAYEINKTALDNIVLISAFLYDPSETTNYVNDRNRYYIAIEISSGKILDTVCDYDLQVNREILVSETCERYVIDSSYHVKYDTGLVVAYTLNNKCGLVELKQDDCFQLLDVSHGRLILCSFDPNNNYSLGNTCFDKDYMYFVTYASTNNSTQEGIFKPINLMRYDILSSNH